MSGGFSRRSFLKVSAWAAGAAMARGAFAADGAPIQGFEDTGGARADSAVWTPVSDRKLRVGIAGYGVCKFGAAFGFQDHPNVEVAAVTDLIPERRDELAKVCRCPVTYPSLEEMVKDPKLDAVFIATDAPSHARHCIEAMKHGKHAATAVPATFGSVEEGEAVLDTVKSTGLKYMMFETTAYRDECHAMRALYAAGALGDILYTEGEYYHYMDTPIDSYKGWRIGLPPQWYPTHSNGFYSCIAGGQFTAVSCVGTKSAIKDFLPENNRYQNPFGTEIALFKTSDGGTARMAVSWDTPGHHGEMGRVRGSKGAVSGVVYDGTADVSKIDIKKPALPPGMDGGGHGGSHGNLCNEFVTAILQDRKPLVDAALALNMTVAGIIAHQSALKDGEWMNIPQYSL